MKKRTSDTMLLKFIVHRSAFIVLIIAQAIIMPGCGARRTPNLERIFEGAHTREGKRPVIVIPGILGSQLVNRRTGEVVWPSAFRSSDDGLALPVSPDLAANRDGLVASSVIEKAKLAKLAPEIYVYYVLLDALTRFGGYREGDWNAPIANGDRDTFYVFAYDWRRDNVETARELVRRVAELKQKIGRPDLKFNVIAHSMGGVVARYAAMYGDSDLPPAGSPPLTWAGAEHFGKIFMFGVPNEGSAEAFATLLEGYSITEGLRRRVRLLNKLSREDALTIPSLFQLLPHGEEARFLDENLQPLGGINLYDPETWRRYGWAAVNDPAYRARFSRGEIQDEAGPASTSSLDELDAYFASALRRARRFHEALDAPVGRDAPVSLFIFGGDCEETLSAPVIFRDERAGRWVTITSARSFKNPAGVKIERKAAVRAMYEPGDGRVTRGSLLGARPGATRVSALYDTPLPVALAVFACDLHSELQNNRILQNNALTLLVNELTF